MPLRSDFASLAIAQRWQGATSSLVWLTGYPVPPDKGEGRCEYQPDFVILSLISGALILLIHSETLATIMDLGTFFTVIGALAGIGSLIVAVIALRGMKQQRIPAASSSRQPYYRYDESYEPQISRFRAGLSWLDRPLWQNSSKLAILLLSIVTILLFMFSLWADDASHADPNDIIIYVASWLLTIPGYVGYVSVWILGMITALRHRRWGWFFLVLGLTPFATLAYAFTD